MNGLRQLRPCLIEDFVWGTLGYAMPIPSGTAQLRYDAAVRVRGKVTPFGRDAGNTRRGEAPTWYEGTPHQFGWSKAQSPFRNSPTVDAGSVGQKYCAGSRVVYVDGDEKFVNYLFLGDPNEAAQGWCHWHQLNTVTDEMDGWSLVLRIDADDGYEAAYDTHTRGNTFIHFYQVGDPWYCGYGMPDNPAPGIGSCDVLYASTATAGTFGANGHMPFAGRPDGWYAGERYLVFSGYLNSDSMNEAARFGVIRYDRVADRWYALTSTVHDAALPWAIVRPSRRAHLRSDAPQPDEPWCIAYDRASNRWGTGRWRGEHGPSLAAELENAYSLPANCGVLSNCLFYDRCRGRDLIILRGPADRVEEKRSKNHWLFDGEHWIDVTADAPTYATVDEQGNLYYGHPRLVKKLGPDGWSIRGTATYGQVGGVNYQPPNVDPEDPEVAYDDPAYVPSSLSAFEEHGFQILVGKAWLSVRKFWGPAALASEPLEDPDWAEWQIADRTNSRDEQATAGDVFFCWGISRDGTQRVPHAQGHWPYGGLRRIHRRLYTGLDPSEPTLLPPSYGDDVRWPKYGHSGFPNDYYAGMNEFRPDLAGFGNLGDGYLFDVFIGHPHNFDFDVVQGPACASSEVRAY